MDKKIELLDHRGNVIEKAAVVGMGALDREFFYSQATGSISTAEVQKRPFQHHVWTYACAYTILTNISRLHLYLYHKDKPSEHIHDHPILDLFRKPNPFMTRSTFIQAILLNLLLTIGGKKGGQCFIICDGPTEKPLDLTRGAMPIMLTPCGDRNVRPEMTAEYDTGMQVPKGWIFDPTGRGLKERHFGFHELIRIYQYNPYDLLQGIANEQPARVAILQDIESDIFNERLYTNAAVPAGILKTDQRLTREQKRDVLAHWYEDNGGPGNVNKLAVMDNNLDYKHIGLTMADMQFQEGKKFFQDQAISAFHLNKIAIGNYENLNRATIEIGRKMLWHDTYMPLAELICEGINSSWISNIESNLRIAFDFSKVEALRDDYSKQAIASKALVESGMPPLEAWKMNGLPVGEDMEKKYPWVIQNPFEMKAAANPLNGIPKEEPVIPAKESEGKTFKNKAVEEDRLKWWEGYIARSFDPGEKQLKVIITNYFNKQRNAILDKVDLWLSHNKSIAKDIKINAAQFLPVIKSENDALKAAIKPALKAQMEREVKELAKQSIDWKVTDPMVDEYIGHRADFLDGLNKLTFSKVKDSVNEKIAEGMRENWTPQELAKEIKTNVTGFYEIRKGHATMIARTEIGAVSGATRFDAMTDNGVEYLEWVTAGDERVRDSHAAINGDTIETGDTFKLDGGELHYPCDFTTGADAGEVINCIVPDTVISGSFLGALKSFYSGNIIEIITKKGNRLCVTVNHPIATDAGFVAANRLCKGDYVVGHTGDANFVSSISNNDIQHRESSVENIFNTIKTHGTSRIHSPSTFDLDGDGQFLRGKVEIVKWLDSLADSRRTFDFKLMLENESPRKKIVNKFDFIFSDTPNISSNFTSIFSGNINERIIDRPSSSNPSISTLPKNRIGIIPEFSPLEIFRVGLASHLNVSRYKYPVYRDSGYSKFLSELTLGFSTEIFLDKIVNIRTIPYSGHVYDLQSSVGYFNTNNIISRNCRCVVIPVMQKPEEQ